MIPVLVLVVVLYWIHHFFIFFISINSKSNQIESNLKIPLVRIRFEIIKFIDFDSNFDVSQII